MISYHKKYIYTLSELRGVVEALRQVFTIVRLVSREGCQSYYIGKDGLVQNGQCGDLWNRSGTCDVCATKENATICGCHSRLETVGSHTYIVISKDIQLDGRPLTLEMIMVLTCMDWLDGQGFALDEIRRLQEENSRLLRDPLTGCYNRYYMDTLFQHYMLEAQNSGLDLCMALVDLDKFKDINDTYGHTIGDEVLRSCGHFWIKYFDIRHRSFITRYGGDEFVIISIAGEYEDFCHRIKTLNDSMRKTVLLEDGQNVPFAFSIGCAHLGELEEQGIPLTCKALLSVADKRMYISKQVKGTAVTTA